MLHLHAQGKQAKDVPNKLQGPEPVHLLFALLQSCMLSHGLRLILTQHHLTGFHSLLQAAALQPESSLSPGQPGIVQPQLQDTVCLCVCASFLQPHCSYQRGQAAELQAQVLTGPKLGLRPCIFGVCPSTSPEGSFAYDILGVILLHVCQSGSLKKAMCHAHHAACLLRFRASTACSGS